MTTHMSLGKDLHTENTHRLPEENDEREHQVDRRVDGQQHRIDGGSKTGVVRDEIEQYAVEDDRQSVDRDLSGMIEKIDLVRVHD